MSEQSSNKPMSVEERLAQGVVGGCLVGFNAAMLLVNWAAGLQTTTGSLANAVGLVCACALVAQAFQRAPTTEGGVK